MTNRTEVIYSGSTAFGSYRIVDTVYNDRPARVLYGDNDSPQSGRANDDNPELLFDYNQRFLEIIESIRPKKVLVIGGSACMLPIAAFNRLPDITIDIVELDPLLGDLAYQYFDAPRDDAFKIHFGDGLKFLRKKPRQYDMIIIDAFLGFTIPPHLYDEAAMRTYSQNLSKTGVVAMNFIGELTGSQSGLTREVVASFRDSFSHVELYQADPFFDKAAEQNFVVTASKSQIEFDYLQSTDISHFVVMKI
ncbi:hypothetical protein B7Y94_01270 [Candidatus Saccharibacteria bacterium 32-49-12]|nr:MAG: hypothetical protein B7Y94_01270 [Candidatus Saccharibacteria bacterium 32-49-12]